MKRTVLLLLIFVSILSLSAYSQLNNGGIYARFGVDADTRTNWVKYGPATGAISTDDWFAPSGAGNNVIDTSNASTYRASLQAGTNITFNSRMASLLYAKVAGKLWLDAVYGRDYCAASTFKDATTFTFASKNGDNPLNWRGGTANIPNKNDLTDVYAHLRRDGLNVHDSLWLFTGVSTYGTNGSSYYDVELYKKTFSYASGFFSTAGTEAGHTQWLFDAAGNITQTGDMILAVSFSPGTPPVVDLRIWVSRTTLTTVNPVYFNFTGAFDGATTGSVYGYASIVSKAGATAWGGGISNYSSTATQDSTYSTPWGTANSTSGWDANYETQQFIEIGLNLSRIGVDPALYSTLNPCQALFSNIFFKSRSSTSFTSNLQDFMTPLTFTRQPVLDYSLKPDTLRCNHTVAGITLTNNTTAGYYTWQTVSGNISGANSDSSQLSIDKPGTYIVSASPAEGCPATRTDTIVVPIDTFPPVASAFAGLSGNKLQLYGGNPTASNYSTPFGGSSGLTYSWTGPNSFSSTIQNPLTDTAWGTYLLMVTENRNGCTATASTTVVASMFMTLQVEGLILTGTYDGSAVSLHWTNANPAAARSYTIERMDERNIFVPISFVSGSNLSYMDNRPLPSNNLYRIRAAADNGESYYSAVLKIPVAAGTAPDIHLSETAESRIDLVASTVNPSAGMLLVYTPGGQLLERRSVSLQKGINTVPISTGGNRQVRIVTLYIGDKLVFAGKAVL